MNNLPKAPGPAPKAHMPFWKSGFLIALALLFDFLKAACIALIFLAPFAVGIGVKLVTEPALVKVFGPDLGSSLATAAGWIAGTTAAGAEIAAAPVTATIEGIGVMLAIMIGIVGWLLLILVLMLSGGFSPFEGGASHFFIILLAFGASITPFVDMFPTFTPAIWKVTSDLRKRDAQLRKKWEGERTAYERARAENQQQRAQAAWAQATDEGMEAEEEFSFEPERTERKSPELIGVPAYA